MAEYNPLRRRRRGRRRLLFLVLTLIALCGAWALVTGPEVPPGSVLLLPLEGKIRERPRTGILGALGGGDTAALIDLVRLIDAAGKDERVAGLVLRVRHLEIGWAKAQDLRDAVVRFRATGKPLAAILQQEVASSTLEYYVAAAARHVYVAPAATVPVSGLLAQVTFLGGVWPRIHVDVQVEQIGRYKSAGDMIRRTSMSDAHREMTNALLDSIFGQFVRGVAASRAMESDAVRMAVDRTPMTGPELVELGLADGVKSLNDVRQEAPGAPEEFLNADDYRAALSAKHRFRRRKKIAVIFGTGAISTGRSPGGLWGEDGMGSDSIAGALHDAAGDDGVEAVVFRIDSPGGSALASEMIWEAAAAAAKRKPLIVSMSDVAASGGYYIACGATRVFAQPGTITGSIGVLMAKPNIGGLLESLGVHTETLVRGRGARLNSLTDSLDSQALDRVRASLRQVYGVFVDRVAAGRGLTHEQVDELGQGRVWTGEQARKNGLVDELGGLREAIAAARKAAHIPAAEEVQIVAYPHPHGWAARLRAALQARVGASLPEWVARLSELTALAGYAPGSVLAVMPERIVIR